MKNPSREQLTKSLDRRIKHLMIRALEKFEDLFPDLDDQRDGQIFKSDLRNMFNDAIRAQRDEVRDYDVEYKPLKLDDNNILSMTRTFMSSVQKIEFGFRSEKPFMRIYSNTDGIKVLTSLRSEMGAGVVYYHDDKVILEIVGLEHTINSVLPIMDRYRLHKDVRDSYQVWREEIVNLYRS